MSDMLGGSFGSPVSKELIDLIKARENLFGKERKTEKELEWIHGNTAWVMLRSGVDTPQGGSQTARRYAMKGGTTSWPQVKGQMFGSGGTSWGGYKLVAFDQGIRPCPGLISLTAKSRDTYGLTLEVNLSFKVWSLEDLSAMDQVYFKPGYPVLLEWGHTMYVDRSGNCVGVWEEKPYVDDSVFYTEQSFADIEKIVQDKRKQYPNYEAVIGLITNFSYSVQKDGSYDCTLKALSKGSVLEGLKLRTGSDFSKDETDKQDENVTYLTSVYHLLLEALAKYKWEKKVGPLPSQVGGDPNPPLYIRPAEDVSKQLNEDEGVSVWYSAKSAWSAFNKAQGPPDSLQDFLVAGIKANVPRKFMFRKTDVQFYVKLRDLLTLLNGVNSGNGYIQWDLNSKNRYVTFPEHASLNPGVAVLPKQPEGLLSECILPTIFLTLTTQDSWGGPNNRADQILNIWINFGSFTDLVTAEIENNSEEFTILKTLEKFLGEIQKALGNVNNFGLHYNESEGVFSIVDRNEVAEETIDEPGSIRITGLNNTVSAFNIQTKISSNMANELSIMAQNPRKQKTDGENEHEQRLVYWGEGCTPRFTCPSDGAPEEGSVRTSADTSEDFSSLKTKLVKIYKALSGKASGLGRNTGSYRESADTIYGEIQLAGENYFKKIVAQNLDSFNTGEDTVQQNGLIPINATITLMGIGHFIVGSIFKLDQHLLPVKYSRRWGYVITAIEHKVDQKGWITTVTTTGYLLNQGKAGGTVSSGPTSTSIKSKPKAGVKKQPPVEQEPKNNMDDSKKTDLFLNYFQSHYPPTSGKCGRGTRCLAWGYVNGKAGIDQTKNGGANHASDPAFGSCLPSSYTRVVHKEGLTKEEVRAYLGNSANVQTGDVATYYHTEFPGGPWVSTGGSERHAQFYTGGGKWETDVKGNYGTCFVYGKKSQRYWTLNLYRTTSKLHSDWSGMGSR